MVIPLLWVKTRCTDKSTAEHYEHTIQYMAAQMRKSHSIANFLVIFIIKRLQEKDFGNC